MLDALLAKYQDEGVLNLDDPQMLRVAPFTSMGSVVQLLREFGGNVGFHDAVHDLQSALYEGVA